jgi:hypothetical protein
MAMAWLDMACHKRTGRGIAVRAECFETCLAMRSSPLCHRFREDGTKVLGTDGIRKASPTGTTVTTRLIGTAAIHGRALSEFVLLKVCPQP